MVNENVWREQELWQKQREAEARVRRMREENQRLAQQMTPTVSEKRPTCTQSEHKDNGRWLPLVLALIILKEGGSTLLVLALLYLAL